MSASGKYARPGKLRGLLSRKAEDVADSPVVTAGARAAYAVNGLLHLLIAWLGVQVAFGGTGAEADPSGAMALVSGTTAGSVVLVMAAVAFALLALWQVTEGVRGPGVPDRIKAGAKALVYAALAWSALTFLMGTGQRGQAQANNATATLLGFPLGPLLVVLAGILVAGVGVYHIYKGWTQKFRRDLASAPSRFTLIAGRVGYIARGVAFIAVGLGIGTAGLTRHPDSSRGLDGALHDMVSMPWGQVVVALIAAGFAAFGLYSFSRARRART